MSQSSNLSSKSRNNPTSWDYLCDVLKQFGASTDENRLVLSWGQQDNEQFDFLSKVISRLVNKRVKGDYDTYSESWSLRI